MKIRRAVGGWSIVAGLYFVALLWADSKTGVLRRLPELAPAPIPDPALVARLRRAMTAGAGVDNPG